MIGDDYLRILVYSIRTNLYRAGICICIIFFRFPADGDPLPKPTGAPRVEAYDYVEEVTDPTRLDDLLADPDEMRMQALVIRERILGM